MTNRIKVGYDGDRPDDERWIVVIYTRTGFNTHRFATIEDAQAFARRESEALR